MSISIYAKQFYFKVSTDGYTNVDISSTLKHIEYLFVCLKSSTIELKQKYGILTGLEKMLLLYNYQENQGSQQYITTFTQITGQIQQLALNGQETQNPDVIKSSFMLTEALFSVENDSVHKKVQEVCLLKLFEIVDQQMIALNTDILALNISLKQDQLQLTRENPLVENIMQKIDIIGHFIRMILRVFEKTTSKPKYMKSYIQFAQSGHLASIFIRVFGIGIQIPNSPNNNSVINITGLQVLDNIINQLKTKSLQCINFLLKKKNTEIENLINTQHHQVINGLITFVPLLIQSLIIFG